MFYYSSIREKALRCGSFGSREEKTFKKQKNDEMINLKWHIKNKNSKKTIKKNFK